MPTQSSTHSRKLSQARRQTLLLEALPTIQRVAHHLVYVYGSPRFEADDLAQIGALAVCEVLQKGLQATGNPTAYLIVVARRSMQRHCGIYASLITTPRKARGYQPTLFVLSLDAPLSADSDQTLLDVLADEALELAEDMDAAYDNWLDCQP